MCGIAPVNGAKCLGVLLYRLQFGYGIAAGKGANCVWDCCCTTSKLGVEMLLYS